MAVEAKNFVFEYFSKLGVAVHQNELAVLEKDYLQEGLVDSYGLLSLISEIESRFSITFNSTDLESPKFRTIGGLIGILESKVGGGAE